MLIRPLTKRFVRTEGPLGLRAGSPLEQTTFSARNTCGQFYPQGLPEWLPHRSPVTGFASPSPTSPAGSFPGRQRRVSDNTQLPSSQGRTMNAGLSGLPALGPWTRETPRHCQHCYQTPSRVSLVEWGSPPSCPPPTLSPLSQKDPASPGSTSGAAPVPGPGQQRASTQPAPAGHLLCALTLPGAQDPRGAGGTAPAPGAFTSVGQKGQRERGQEVTVPLRASDTAQSGTRRQTVWQFLNQTPVSPRTPG